MRRSEDPTARDGWMSKVRWAELECRGRPGPRQCTAPAPGPSRRGSRR
ncbi:unnamed protein product, partial [Staurois parvus]